MRNGRDSSDSFDLQIISGTNSSLIKTSKTFLIGTGLGSPVPWWQRSQSLSGFMAGFAIVLCDTWQYRGRVKLLTGKSIFTSLENTEFGNLFYELDIRMGWLYVLSTYRPQCYAHSSDDRQHKYTLSSTMTTFAVHLYN